MSDYIVNKKNLLNQRGVLIESDAGFISPIDSRNTPFINEIKKLDSGVRISNDEPLVVYVVLQKYAVKNRNGRIYPENILRREVEKYQQVIRERRAVGELDHPDTSIIASDRISHNILETWWEGKTLMGKMEILMTPGYINYGIVSTKGDEVANLLRNNIMIGVSSRGLGSLREVSGDLIVQDDFEIIPGLKGLTLVNVANFNNYLAGVVESEGGTGKEIEYYKVQALMSRTYALKYLSKHVKEGFNLCDRVHCQAYHYKLRFTPDIEKAVRATENVVMEDERGNLVDAYFHANCGGQTSEADYIWNNRVEYLNTFKDTFCIYTKQATWEKRIPKQQWADFLIKDQVYILSLVSQILIVYYLVWELTLNLIQ
jgi:hypothetical protein